MTTPALCAENEDLETDADVTAKLKGLTFKYLIDFNILNIYFIEEVTDGIAPENLSLESNESLASSGISEAVSSPTSSSTCTKRARTECTSELKNKRAFLFNKLVQLMPPSMVQPERNLSDFVVM